MRRAARAAAALALASLLCGCASLDTLVADLRGKPVAPAADDATPEAPPEPDVYTLEVRAPEPLRGVLAKHLDLARFRDARVAGAVTRHELDRLIAAAPAQARALAETEGFFDAEVTVSRDRDAAVPHVVVNVAPGPQARVAEVGIAVEGPLYEAIQRGDEAAIDTAAMLVEQWPLSEGMAFAQGAWAGAKNGTLARLRAQGYPLARWRTTAAQVDAPTQQVKLQLALDSGPLFRIGQLRVAGVERYDEQTVRNLLDFTPGEVYTEALLAQWQRHIQRSELFESAVVALQVDPTQADAATVTIDVREFPSRQATVGIGYSSDTGARATLDTMHRLAFGLELVATNRIEYGNEKRAWTGQLISHPLPDHYRNLVSMNLEWLDQNDELRKSGNLRLGRNQDSDDFGRQYFVALQGASVYSAAPTTSARAVTANYNWVRRDIDSIALPTRGIVFAAQTAAGYTYETLAATGAFARLAGALTGYRPLGGDWNLQWRVEAGEVFANSATGVPDQLLFRAGGQDSVRGYAFRSLGPIVNGVVTSGRMLATASIELARPFVARLPEVWGAVFFDAGNAANRWQDLKPVYSVGPGVRWRSPVGSLRIDLPYAIENRQWRIEVSLGIAP